MFILNNCLIFRRVFYNYNLTSPNICCIVSFPLSDRTTKETETEQKTGTETEETQEDFFAKVFCRQSANATSN